MILRLVSGALVLAAMPALASHVGPYPDPETLVWPLSGTTAPAEFSSTFGPRKKASEDFRYDWHRGVDLPTPCLSPAFAIADGVVRMAGDYPGRFVDRVVELCHPVPGAPASVCGSDADDDGVMDDLDGDGITDGSVSSQAYYSVYIHMATAAVGPGQVVTQGDTVGGTGESGIGYTGVCHPDDQPSPGGFDHLHFEIRDGGVTQAYAVHPLAALPYADAGAPALALTSVDLSDPAHPVVGVRVTEPTTQLDLNRVDLFLYDMSSGSPVEVGHQAVDLQEWTLQYSADVAILDTAPEYDGVYDDTATMGADAGVTVDPSDFTSGDPAAVVDVTFWGLVNPVAPADLMLRARVTDVRNNVAEADLFPAVPALSIGSATVGEADSGTKGRTFTVTLSRAPIGVGAAVSYATAGGSAASGVDFVAKAGTLSFAPGVTQRVVTVQTVGDVDDERGETFALSLSAPVNATVQDGGATGTILDNDPAPPGSPALSIANATVAEADTGTKARTFTVTLSAPGALGVLVDYETAEGTATAGSDFTPKAGTLSFAPGATSRTVTVQTTGDVDDERDEAFLVSLGDPVNATLQDGVATGTILDNDPAPPGSPALSIADPALIWEADTGTRSRTFTVTLSAPAALGVLVDYATAEGTATAGSDFTSKSGTLSFAPGVTSRTLSVATIGDTADEPTEAFSVALALPVNATVQDGIATGTIKDNDPAPPGSPAVSIADAALVEADTGTRTRTFTVTLSAPAALPVQVSWETLDATAHAGEDYVAKSGIVLFAPGETVRTLGVNTLGDTVPEADEAFAVILFAPVNATLGDAGAMGTILDNDPALAGPPPPPEGPWVPASR